MVPSSLISRNIKIHGRRTSIRLEPSMWEALAEICGTRELTTHDFCTRVDENRGESSLTAAIRVAIVEYYRELARSGQPPSEPVSYGRAQAASVATPVSREDEATGT